MSIFHYDDTPTPVGNPVRMDGKDAYQLGLYDGALYVDQYADEPEEAVLFQSPEAAGDWLRAVQQVLRPYIDSGNDERRVPNAYGWAEED